MLEMAKTALVMIWWLAGKTATVAGLALMVALTVGLASSALAAVPGDPLKLGRLNAINAVTQLVGATNNPLLRVQNLSSGDDAAALELRVEGGTAPLIVNPGAGKATGLNADRVDGKSAVAFFSGKTYEAQATGNGTGGGALVIVRAFCDQEDKVMSGGTSAGNIAEDDLVQSIPAGARTGWQVIVRDNGAGNNSTVTALCADFPPFRP